MLIVCARLRRLPVLLLFLLAVPSARAATLNVPSASYPTIQAGITAAQPGDMVLVADGTYTGPGNVDLDFGGKAITVVSVNGAGSTVINCQGSSNAPHRAFLFHSGETSATTVSGFTLENGYAPADASPGDGGAVTVTSGSPTFLNCVFSGSAASAYGGALYVGSGSSITLAHCTFTGNAAQYGGAVNGEASSALSVSGCSFQSNTATASAGAVHCSAVTFTDCVFSGNAASSGTGGGVYVSSASAAFVRCTVSGNAASAGSGGGGGVYAYNSALMLDTCAFLGNSASYGGGLALYSGSGSTLTNCLLVGNSAGNGGGVYLGSASPSIINCTLAANTASARGGALFIGASPALTNCILYGDSASASGSEVYVNGGSLTAAYCDIQGGASGTGGNINADPLFVRAPTVSGNPPDFGDLHLQSGSPCIGAGTASGAPAADFDGHARPNPPSIGAYDVSSTDTSAPTTTAALSGTLNGNGAYTGPVTVTLTATDPDGAGDVAATFYTLDGGTQQTYNAPFMVSGVGSHIVVYFSKDKASNQEAQKTAAFTIAGPAPTLSSLSPNQLPAGSPAFTMTVTGTGFVNGSAVQWNGMALVTTYVSATTLKAAVLKSLVASAGTASVTVTNSTSGGGVSNAKPFTINATTLKVTVGMLTRDASTGNITVPLTVQNVRSQTAANVQVTASTLGGYQTLSPLPVTLGSLPVGASVSLTLTYPVKAGTAGSARLLAVSGTYTGGKFNSMLTVTLP